MGNLTSQDLEKAGEDHVEKWLSENGYSSISWETLFPADREIRATGSLGNMIILVRTFLHPNRPFKLSEYETHKITLRASREKYTAYAAYVIVDEDRKLVGDIIWERIG